MKADEIRKKVGEFEREIMDNAVANPERNVVMTPQIQAAAMFKAAVYLGEIAAQLAELNAKLTPGELPINVHVSSDK